MKKRTEFQRKKILIVDDDDAIREVLQAAVEVHGHLPVVATQGKEALEMLFAKPLGYFGLVILDQMMPVMDGHEFLRNLRGNPNYQSVPVILISATTALKNEDVAVMADAVLLKPLELDLLFVTMDRILGP